MHASQICLLACDLTAECDAEPDARLLGELAPGVRKKVMGKRQLRDRWGSIAGRLLLRHALVAVGAGNISLQELDRRADDAPEVPAPFAGSISHTARMVVAVAAAGGAIGIDVEGERAAGTHTRVAAKFSPYEQALLQGDDGQRVAFAEIWTRKEALAKASGRHLFRVLPQPVMQDRVTFDDRVWNLWSLRLDDEHCCAIAWDRAPPRPQLRRLALSELVA